MPNIALEQEFIAVTITIALVILHLHASDVQQRNTFNRSQAAILLWGADFRSRPSTKLSRI